MNQPLKQTLSLPMLEPKSQVTLYMNGEKKMVKLSRKQTIDVEIPTNGGLVVVQ
jgi:hypothetical protein